MQADQRCQERLCPHRAQLVGQPAACAKHVEGFVQLVGHEQCSSEIEARLYALDRLGHPQLGVCKRCAGELDGLLGTTGQLCAPGATAVGRRENQVVAQPLSDEACLGCSSFRSFGIKSRPLPQGQVAEEAPSEVVRQTRLLQRPFDDGDGIGQPAAIDERTAKRVAQCAGEPGLRVPREQLAAKILCLGQAARPEQGADELDADCQPSCIVVRRQLPGTLEEADRDGWCSRSNLPAGTEQPFDGLGVSPPCPES